MPITQRVAAAAEGLRATDTAFAMDTQRISYRELARRAAAVAAGLASATLGQRREWMPGDARLLAIGTENHTTFAELFVGATAGDGACAVLDPQWAPEQAAAILRRLRPDVLVVAGTQSGLLETGTRLGIPTLVVGGAHAPDSYEKWMNQYAGADPREHLTAGDDTTTFLVGFTSGTTSVPKAFHRSRRSWRLSLAHGRLLWGMDAARHTLAPGPLAQGLSLYALAECLDVSAAFHSAARFDATAVAQQLAADDIRRLVVAPTMLKALCAAATTRGVTLPRVDTVVSGAAKLDPQLIPDIEQVLPNARVTEYYGASEIGFITVRAPESGASRLLDLCRPRLPRYKVPRRFYTVNAWPLTASGKIARGQIEEWLAYQDARLTPVPW